MNNPQTRLVPKLRFPEFRRAEGWKAEPMGGVYSFRGNNSLSRDKLNYIAGSVKNIHYGDIHTKFSSHFDITKELVPFINESELSAVRDENLCVEGDMIFADASEDMADIGKCIELVCLNGERLVTGLHTILARRTRDRIALGFGGHLFKSGWVRAQIQKEAQGAKVLGISANRMRNLRLPLPPTPAEQQKITDCLSSLDELIVAQARKVEVLKTHKKGLMQQLFPREGETQPRLRLPEFQNAGEWQRVRLDEIGRVIRGSSPRPQGDPRFFGGPVPRLMVQDVTRDGKWVTPRIDSLTDEGATMSRPCPAGTLTIVCSGVVGIVSFLAVDACIHDGFLALADIDESQADKDFLFHTLSTLRNEFERGATHGGVFTNLTTQGIKDFVINFPGIPEQQRIASCLTSLDDLITAVTKELETLKTHKKGLVQQLFPTAEAIAA